jgi:hypothetical protein
MEVSIRILMLPVVLRKMMLSSALKLGSPCVPRFSCRYGMSVDSDAFSLCRARGPPNRLDQSGMMSLDDVWLFYSLGDTNSILDRPSRNLWMINPSLPPRMPLSCNPDPGYVFVASRGSPRF